MKKILLVGGTVFAFSLFLIVLNFSINSDNMENSMRSMEISDVKGKAPIILQETEIGNKYKKPSDISVLAKSKSNSQWKETHILLEGPDLGYNVEKNITYEYYPEMPTPPQRLLDRWEEKAKNPSPTKSTIFMEYLGNQAKPSADAINIDDYLDESKKKLEISKSEINTDTQVTITPSSGEPVSEFASQTGIRAPIVGGSTPVTVDTINTFNAEPSAANHGNIVFMTGNTWAARSTDGGNNFSYVNPFSDFSLLCCDQDVIYNDDHDVWVWYRQGDADVSLGGTNRGINEIKISVSTDDAVSWCTLTFHDTFIDAGLTDAFIDYPHLQTTDDKLYISTNIFPNGGGFQSAVLRFDLAQIAACNFGSHQTFLSSIDGTLTPVNGATDTMYFASNISATQTRVYSMQDVSNTVNSNLVTYDAYPSSGYSCTMPGTGSNPCNRSDPRIMGGYLSNGILGFVWDAAQGGDFTYPYVKYITVAAGTGTLLATPDFYSNSYAVNFANFGVNNAGDIGVGLFIMGGGNTPSYLVGIDDSLTGTNLFDFVTVKTSTHSPIQSNWGDYVRVKPYKPDNGNWVATGFTNQGGTGANNVENLFVTFGRTLTSIDDIALHRDSGWWLIDTDFNGVANTQVRFGILPGDQPLVGDFNGDGTDDIALHRDSGWWLIDTDFNGVANTQVRFGILPGDQPLVGDFNGDGTDDIALHRDSGWWLIDTDFNGVANTQVRFGILPGDQPLVGDFNGDGTDDIALHRDSGWWLIDTDFNGVANTQVRFGILPGDQPLVGDFNGDGTDDIALHRDSGWWLIDTDFNGVANTQVRFGILPGDQPLVGDFNGDGTDDIALHRDSGWWLIDTDFNGVANTQVRFGILPGDQPLVGRW